jgi:hypothetical protein
VDLKEGRSWLIRISLAHSLLQEGKRVSALLKVDGENPRFKLYYFPYWKDLIGILGLMNWKFVFRGLILATIILGLGAVAAFMYISQFNVNIPTGPTPPPPTILVPQGSLPETQVGFKEWAKYGGNDYVPVGNGFFLGIDGDIIIGVTTAHSVSTFDSNHSLAKIAFSIADQPGFIAEMDTLYGEPGKPRYGKDMTVDFILLCVDEPIDPLLVLSPDPRGEPQAGERILLYSGLGDGAGGLRVYPGTIMTVDKNGAWAVMDDNFSPAGMSGSPFFSEHTGKVVGMAIVTGNREGRLMIGMHTIGSLVKKIESATEFPLISNYQP